MPNYRPFVPCARSVPATAFNGIPVVGALALMTAAFGGAVDYQGVIAKPALDRWMYPFASQAGAEPTISTFGSDPADPTLFDSRDGQMLTRFDTSALVPSGLGASRYQVASLRISLQFANDLIVQYDPTADPWQCFLPESDPNWQPDADPGQPIDLFGVGFRNGFSLQTFAENSPYSVPPNSPLTPSVRNAFSMSFDANSSPIDVSNNPRVGFDPKRFAIGTIEGLAPGDFIPIDTVMHFDVNVSDPDI